MVHLSSYFSLEIAILWYFCLVCHLTAVVVCSQEAKQVPRCTSRGPSVDGQREGEFSQTQYLTFTPSLSPSLLPPSLSLPPSHLHSHLPPYMLLRESTIDSSLTIPCLYSFSPPFITPSSAPCIPSYSSLAPHAFPCLPAFLSIPCFLPSPSLAPFLPPPSSLPFSPSLPFFLSNVSVLTSSSLSPLKFSTFLS